MHISLLSRCKAQNSAALRLHSEKGNALILFSSFSDQEQHKDISIISFKPQLLREEQRKKALMKCAVGMAASCVPNLQGGQGELRRTKSLIVGGLYTPQSGVLQAIPGSLCLSQVVLVWKTSHSEDKIYSSWLCCVIDT